MTTAVANAAAATTQQTSSRATLSQNFETFLTLLTSQLKNQDPLSPIDSNQFTQQLVQYSQVEQQIQTNDTLKTLTDQQKANASGAALSYLGRTATITDATTRLSDGEAEWTYTLPAPAAEATISIRDASGREVYRTNAITAAGAHTFQWDGKSNNGQAQPDGLYSMQIRALDGSAKAISAAVTVNETITGVDLSGAAPQVTTASGPRSFALISAVRQ